MRGLAYTISQASRDIEAEYADASEADYTVSNDAETAATSGARCSSNHGPESDDNEQMNEADNGMCSGDENKADNKASKNHARAEERSNKVKKKEGEIEKAKKGHGDAHKSNDGAEDEEEREKVRGCGSELRKIDSVRKPVEVGEYRSHTTEAGANQQEVQFSERLNQTKRIPLLGTPNKKRQGSTNSVLENKRRKTDTTILALLNKSQISSDQNPSSDLQKGQIRDQSSRDKENKPGTIKTAGNRQFREDCRDILNSIFKTIWDPKSQFISITDPLPSYRVVDEVGNLEPVIDVIEDNEINHVLAAMLRVVNQVFLMRTIEVACAKTSGSAHHAQGIVLQRIASHLQHRQVQRGKSPLSRTAAMAAARQLKSIFPQTYSA